MKKSKFYFALAFIMGLGFLLVAGCFPPCPKVKSWTFMLYLNGDEVSMQQDYIAAFHEMIARQVGSSEDVNIVIQFDRYPGMDDFGGWEIAHRFYYTQGMEPTEENAIADWGDGRGGREVNMADPDTLADFISWAHQHYPARHNALMLADHGYGWRGLLIDVTSDGDFMTVKDLARVLRNSRARFDLLAFNACLMQMIEVMHEISDSGIQFVVGSENDGLTWPLADIVQRLTDNPSIAAEDFAKSMVDHYHAAHAETGFITLSSVRLNQVPDLVDAFTEMVQTILGDHPFTEVQQQAQIVLDHLDATIAYRKNGADWEDAGGLALYWPLSEIAGIPTEFFYFYTQQTVRFAADSHWRDFLWVFYNHMAYPDVIPPEIYHIRAQLNEFEDPHIDLYQFCQAIVTYTN